MSTNLDQLDRMGYRTSRHAGDVADTDLWAEQAANPAIHKHRAKSLATEHPELAKQFDIDANDGIKPESVSPGTMNKYW